MSELPKLQSCELTNGEVIAYRIFNEEAKTTALLVHGNLSDHLTFKEVLIHPALSGLRMIAVDVRGFGESTYKTPALKHEDYAADLQDFCGKVGLHGIIGIGWSTGGAILQELAATTPDLFTKILLICSVPFAGIRFKTSGEQKQLIMSREVMGATYEPIEKAIREENRAMLKNLWMTAIFNHKGPPEDKRFEEIIDSILKQRNASDIMWANQAFNITTTHNGISDGNGKMNDIKCPIVFLHGKADVIFPPATFTECKEQNDKVTLIELDSGHSPLNDCPDDLCKALAEQAGL